IREEKRALVPAVCYVDGSGRLHTVSQEANPLYHRLISDFYSLTSVPMVLNTSFNENEPVVCRPEGAVDCCLRTQMDVLVLGSLFITRGPRESKTTGRRDHGTTGRRDDGTTGLDFQAGGERTTDHERLYED